MNDYQAFLASKTLAIQAAMAAMKPWQRPRRCAWCRAPFVCRYVQEAKKRFCDRSCSAKWRMSQPEILAKVHAPDVERRRGEKKSAWFRAGSPSALRDLARIRALTPTTDPVVCAKISRTLKAMGHGPSVRGGNGRGMTEPQRLLLAALGPNWTAEFAVSLGRRTAGYPTSYKIDLADPDRKIGIEVDGFSHSSRRALDAKKDEKLRSLGWTVLRVTNQAVLQWSTRTEQAVQRLAAICEAHGIRLGLSQAEA